MRSNVRALSKIIWVIIILCSIVFGALLSYVWVLGNFYAEPNKIVNLVVTNAVFPSDHADRFNVTVLNTSNSIASTNITQIYVTPEGLSGLVNVTDTSPDKIPITVDRGTSKTINCQANWGNFSGDKLLVHLVTTNATITSPAIQTEFIGLSVSANFDPAISVKYFNATVTNNAQSAINLTVSDMLLSNTMISNNDTVVYPTGSNTTELFPTKLAPRQSINVQCFADWTGNIEPTVTVETVEGYSAEVTENISAAVGLTITDVTFNVANPSANDFNITLSNSEASAADVNVTKLVLITENDTEYTIPTGIEILKNQTETKNIFWSWKNYRNKSLNLTAYTKQGFTSTSEVVTTPKPSVFDFTPTFNLTNTGTFKINVTNEACSLQTINVTSISFNQNVTTMTPTSEPIANGTTQLFNVTWNWANFRGQTATITVTANNTININETITLPKVDLRLACNFNKSLGIPYGNVTITSTSYSNQTVTITQVTFTANATTYSVDGTLTNPTLSPSGPTLGIGKTVTVVCPWNWTRYHGQEVTVTIQTKEGFTVSKIFLIP